MLHSSLAYMQLNQISPTDKDILIPDFEKVLLTPDIIPNILVREEGCWMCMRRDPRLKF